MPPSDLSLVNMDPEEPLPYDGDGTLLDAFPVEAIDRLVETFVGSPLLHVEVRQLGGALGRPAAAGGAVSHLDAEFAVFGVGIAMTPEMGAAAAAQMDVVREALAPWEAETTYLNFAERDVPGDRIFGPYAHHRLRAVKAAYDPADLFRSNHPVEPAR